MVNKNVFRISATKGAKTVKVNKFVYSTDHDREMERGEKRKKREKTGDTESDLLQRSSVAVYAALCSFVRS